MRRALQLVRKARPLCATTRFYARSIATESNAKWSSHGGFDGLVNGKVRNEEGKVESKTKEHGLDALEGLALHAEPNTKRVVIDG